jgi:lysophospholipase L1-like esterase
LAICRYPTTVCKLTASLWKPLLIVALTNISVATGCGKGSMPPKVIFIGDSITQLWGDSQLSPAFVQNTNWTDKGISGQTSTQVLARFQTDVIEPHPNIVHILVGTNDVYPGWQLVSVI